MTKEGHDRCAVVVPPKTAFGDGGAVLQGVDVVWLICLPLLGKLAPRGLQGPCPAAIVLVEADPKGEF